jgi:hypothetical protein
MYFNSANNPNNNINKLRITIWLMRDPFLEIKSKRPVYCFVSRYAINAINIAGVVTNQSA